MVETISNKRKLNVFLMDLLCMTPFMIDVFVKHCKLKAL